MRAEPLLKIIMQAANAAVGKARDIGLVLSGGGAKGAYQAGVWKSLVESGVANRIAAISGTSVGAINAAAFAAVWNPDRIRDIWHQHVSSVVSPNLKALSPLMVLEAISLWADGKAFPLHGLLDRDKVADVLSKALPTTWSGEIPSIYATSLQIQDNASDEFDRASYRAVRFHIDEERDPSRRRSEILASCAIPWCYSPVEIDGKRHVDGGWDEMGGENVPLSPILENHPEIKTVVVVRCNSADLEPEPLRNRCRENLRVVEIRPRRPLPGIFDMANLGGGMLSGTLPFGVSDFLPASAIASALGGFFASSRAKIWGATLAFSPRFTDIYFQRGYENGLDVLSEKLLATTQI